MTNKSCVVDTDGISGDFSSLAVALAAGDFNYIEVQATSLCASEMSQSYSPDNIE